MDRDLLTADAMQLIRQHADVFVAASAPSSPTLGSRSMGWTWRAAVAPALLGGIFLAGTIARARSTPFWFDEIFTYHIANVTGMSDVWHALASGVDLNPPLYYVLVRAAARVLGPGELATRLPAVGGFLVMMLCLFRLLRPRVGALGAAAGATLPVLSGVGFYAYEGRAYGVVMGCAAAAALAWQRATAEEDRPIAALALALALGVAVSSHYYAALLLIPLAVGEAVSTIVRRRVAAPIWAAFAAGMLPLLVFLPLIREARLWAHSFWAKPSFSAVTMFYQKLFDLLGPRLAIALLAAGVLVCVYRAAVGRADVARTDDRDGRVVCASEIAFAIALVLLPVAGWLVSVVATGAWTWRYGVSAVIGIAMLLVFAIDQCGRAMSRIMFCVLLLAFVAREAGFVREGTARQVPTVLQPIGDAAAVDAAPVVVSDPIVYLQFAYYAAPDVAARLVCLVPPERQIRKAGYATAELGLLRLKTIAPLRMEDFDTFMAKRQPFQVFGPPAWLMNELLSLGVDLRLQRQGDGLALYAASFR